MPAVVHMSRLKFAALSSSMSGAVLGGHYFSVALNVTGLFAIQHMIDACAKLLLQESPGGNLHTNPLSPNPTRLALLCHANGLAPPASRLRVLALHPQAPVVPQTAMVPAMHFYHRQDVADTGRIPRRAATLHAMVDGTTPPTQQRQELAEQDNCEATLQQHAEPTIHLKLSGKR